jgi:predicted phosphohydrolase
MTRALILADLHWDHWQSARRDPFAGLPASFWTSLDLMILAGDISNKAHVRWRQVFSDLQQRMQPGKLQVFPGNHDPYQGKIDDDEKLMAQCTAAGVGYAQRRSFSCGNHRFLCCTLWTDLQLHGPVAENAARAERVMNDYKMIRVGGAGYRKLRALDTVALHRADLDWLTSAFAVPFDGETIVVTHHAPLAPQPPQEIDAAYGSDLTAFITAHQPKLWLFGHTHRAQTAQIGRTHLRNVSLGYPDERRETAETLAQRLEEMVIDI